MNNHITTPFGRRPLTAAQISAQANAAACPSNVAVNKWTVFRHIALAKDRFGISDRTLAVLNALLTFHPETALVAGEGADLIVFPSNSQLALRAHGMAEQTLRRHLAALVEAGIVIRRDSPNGKRYARKGQGGLVVQAFGFDLAPIVVRAEEFEQKAELVAAERQALLRVRETVSILRRDAVKLMESGAEAGIDADWKGLQSRYAAIVDPRKRNAKIGDLQAAADLLTALVADVSNILADNAKSKESSGNAIHDERHYHNSNSDFPDSRKAAEDCEEGQGGTDPVTSRAPAGNYPLSMVLDACPDIAEYTRGTIQSWRDLVTVADLVRSMLGISASAWREAQEIMGPDAAAATVAAILQRAEHIRSPGGYLRTLVERKRAGQFSLGPVLQALLRERGERGGWRGERPPA